MQVAARLQLGEEAQQAAREFQAMEQAVLADRERAEVLILLALLVQKYKY